MFEYGRIKFLLNLARVLINTIWSSSEELGWSLDLQGRFSASDLCRCLGSSADIIAVNHCAKN